MRFSTARTTVHASPTLGEAWKRFGVHLLLFIAVSTWAGSFAVARMLLSPQDPGTSALSPMMLATVRLLLAAAVLVPFLLHHHARREPLRRSDIPALVLLGQVGVSAFFWFQYTGIQLTSAAVASVVVLGLAPLATMLVSGLSLGESLGRRRFLALALGATGTLVVVSRNGLLLSGDGGFLLGILFLVVNALTFGVYSTMVRGVAHRYSPVALTGWTTATGAAGLVLMSLASEDWRSLTLLSGGQWIAIAYLAIGCTVIAYMLYNYALSRIEASKAAVWILLEVPMAVLFAAVILGELITVQVVVGGLIILTSLYFTQRT